MGVVISGWVEFTPDVFREENEEDRAWISWMEVGAVVEFNDKINWLLFGNPKDFQTKDLEYKPIAKGRGIPSNPGYYLKKDVEDEMKFAKEYPSEKSYGFTHIYFNEIEGLGWNSNTLEPESDWWVLFKIIHLFIELRGMENDQVRITVWYSW